MANHDSNLKRLMLLMNQAFLDCKHNIDPLETERLAEVVYQVMSARYRIFHTMDHIFTTAENVEGPAIFAALFHDIIYYQVDKRIHPLLMKVQSEFTLNEKTNECSLPPLDTEKWLTICGKVFGFKPGQTLNPFNGLNEFLSAVAAARMLSKFMTEIQTLQVIACIEATIPFRSQQDPKANSFNLLRSRLGEVNQEFGFNASDAQLDDAVRLSVQIANQDICSFYSKDFGEFISGTWNLILENNPIFKNPLYTVLEYRKALQKVRGFFSILNYENVVHEWGNYPEHGKCAAMKQQVKQNLASAILYLDIKLVEMTMLEVIAESTGGDAPYFLMIGESSDGSGKAPIERYFPENKKTNSRVDETVYRVLKEGRKAKTSFDFNHSPIAAYLYENLTAEEMTQAMQLAQEFHDGKIAPQAFIRSFRPEILQPISRGISEISWSRKLYY